MNSLFALILSLTPAAAPTQIQPWERCSQFEPLIRKVGLPVRKFSYIAWRESRCLPNVIGNNGANRPDFGLFQINGTWVTVTSKVCRAKYGDMKVLLKPECNAKVAAYLYANGGDHHWKGSTRAWRRGNV